MGAYIKGELPTKFNGITMEEAVHLADEYLENNTCDRMWDAIRALRDFCECVTDEATEVKTPHGRLIDEDAFSDIWSGNHIGDEDEGRYHDAQWIYRDEVDKVPTVIEAEVE